MSNDIQAYWIGRDTADCIIQSNTTDLFATLGIQGLAVLQRGQLTLVLPVAWLQVAAYYQWEADCRAGRPVQATEYYWGRAEEQFLGQIVAAEPGVYFGLDRPA